MRLKDLPPSLRKFTLHSKAVPLSGIQRVTGIDKVHIAEIRRGWAVPDERTVKMLAAYFNVTPEFFEAALPLIVEWGRMRYSGQIPAEVLGRGNRP